MSRNHSPRLRWLGKLLELESLIIPYFNYVAAILALAVLAALLVGEVSPWFDTKIRPLYAALTLLLVVEVLRRIYSANRAGPDTSRAAANQDEALQHLAEYVRETSFRGEVRILLYAGSAIDSFLKQLIKADVKKVQLLTCDPSCALNTEQAARIKAQIDQRKRTLRGAHNIETRHYVVPASLRGVYLKGEIIAIGWYTYESKIANAGHPKGKDLDLHGPSNAMIIMDVRTSPGRTVADFFERTFSQLWTDPAESSELNGKQSAT